jgi:hypothetical protein
MTEDSKRQFFTRSIFGNIEIGAVIGIFSLYLLEFFGIHTFSQLVPPGTTTANIPALSFLSVTSGVSGEQNIVTFDLGTVLIMIAIPVLAVIYIKFIRSRLKKGLKK